MKPTEIEVRGDIAIIHCGGRHQAKAVIDAASLPLVAGKTWNVWPTSGGNYIGTYHYRGDLKVMEFLHRILLSAPKSLWVDHINGDGLDNRLCNLRLADKFQNARNRRLGRDNRSGYKGVSRTSNVGTYWRAYIWLQGRSRQIGQYKTPIEAAKAYDAAAVEHYGEFAKTNKMMGLI